MLEHLRVADIGRGAFVDRQYSALLFDGFCLCEFFSAPMASDALVVCLEVVVATLGDFGVMTASAQDMRVILRICSKACVIHSISSSVAQTKM